VFRSRTALTAVGLTVAAVGSMLLVQSPAMAASTGVATVGEGKLVDFHAAKGKANRLVISTSGRTVIFDDVYAIKAGRGQGHCVVG
jgi:serralysin